MRASPKVQGKAIPGQFFCTLSNQGAARERKGTLAFRVPVVAGSRRSRQIVQRITSVTTPDRIILFGSASTGQMTKDSDIDLLVLERNAQDNRGERLRIRRALKDLGHPFDVIVMPTERFEESKNIIGGIAYPANKYGRVVYEITGRG